MRLLLQRVTQATVSVEGRNVGQIGTGLLVLAGFGAADTADLPASPLWKKMLAKVVELRIFPDDAGKMNKSLIDAKGDLLLVSQFTLYADCKKGRRPSFTASCPPDIAQALYNTLVTDFTALVPTPAQVSSGIFGAEMLLDFTNWGPVTILLDSDDM